MLSQTAPQLASPQRRVPFRGSSQVMQGVSQHSVDTHSLRSNAAAALTAPFLAADVGGTHARIGLIQSKASAAHSSDDRLQVIGYRKYVCASYPNLSAILREFLRETGARPAAACIACAGYALGDNLINANLPWSVSISSLRRDLGLEHVALINDFKAIAYATHFHPLADSTPITGAGPDESGQPQLVVGPGTGLGAAVLFPGTPRPKILTSEAGHAAIAPRTALELQIVRRLGKGVAHVPNEQILSGPGLLTLYRVLCEIRAVQPRFESPVQITAAALGADDALAEETVACFCAWLGSMVGDLAVLFGAYGGVSLAGGFLPQILPLLRRSEFAARFRNKGTLREVLERVPVRLIEHGQLGVAGAAHWYLDNEYKADAG